jgi:hypothetical protein
MTPMSFRIRWLLLGIYPLIGFFGIGGMYNWPVSFLIGISIGIGLGISLLVIDRRSVGDGDDHRPQSQIVVLAPLIGLLIFAALRLIGNNDLIFLIGGSAITMLLFHSIRMVLFGEYQPPPTADRRSPSTQTGHERLRREEEQWREEQRRKREQGR